jgi:flagellar protein FliO/FliZ
LSGYGGYLIETFVTLLAVCAIAWVVLYGARRVGLGRAQGPIQLVGQLPLDARRSVYLVKVGAQVLVVGVAEGGMTKLGEIAAADLPQTEAPAGPSFAAVLARVLAKNAGEKSPKKKDEERPS